MRRKVGMTRRKEKESSRYKRTGPGNVLDEGGNREDGRMLGEVGSGGWGRFEERRDELEKG